MSEALKRITATIAAGTVGQVIVFLSRIVLVPLYLTAWGTNGYGQWILISSFAAYLGTLDIGVQMYVMNRLTQAHSRGDLDEYHIQQNTAFAYYAVLAAAASAALALFVYSTDVSRVLGADMPPLELAHVLMLLGAGIVWALPASIIWNTARTAGNPAASQWFSNLQTAGVLLFSAAALLLLPSMKLVAAIPLVSVLATCAVAYAYNRRRVPEVRLGLRAASAREAASMIRPSALFGLIVVAVALGQQIPLLLISHSIGIVAVAVFATSRTLAGLIRQVVSLLGNATWTDLTRLESRGDSERLSSAMRILVATSMLAVIALAGALWFDVPAVIHYWTRGRIEPDLGLLRLMLLQVVVQTLWMSASNIPAATNRHRSLSMSYMVSNVAGVALSALLLPRFGLNAIPISFIAAEIVACVHFVLRDACKIVGMDYPAFLVKTVSGSAIMSVAVWAAALAIQATIPGGAATRLTASMVFVPLVAAGVAWIFLFTVEDRQRLLGWAKRIAPPEGVA